MRTNIIRMYSFFEPALKIIVGLLVNRVTFLILEKLAGFYMFLILCMAFIFYMRDRLDMTLTFMVVVCLINLTLKYMGNNIWKIEMWARNRNHVVIIQQNPVESSRFQ
ncbi:conserved hypothetical protein, membrane [Candidatus Magnetomorum sp. HK-1]|nr:conserved hypothetical protein, membrane [Candidatus Magnetomorum sp. HK-1]